MPRVEKNLTPRVVAFSVIGIERNRSIVFGVGEIELPFVKIDPSQQSVGLGIVGVQLNGFLRHVLRVPQRFVPKLRPAVDSSVETRRP